MRKLWLWLFIGLWLVGFSSAPLAAQDATYAISRYEASFELVPDADGVLRDVAVSLYITYDVTAGEKSEGFKFIGTRPVRDISVTDGNNAPLKYKLEQLEENRLTWYFPTRYARQQQTVIAHFTLQNAITGNLKKNSLQVEWVKNWKVPVYDVTYYFFLPADYHYEKLTARPEGGTVIDYKGRRVLQVHQAQLTTEPFRVEFAPGVAQARASGGSELLIVLPFLFGGLFIFIIVNAIIHPSGNQSDSSGGSSGGSSCGGSSCGGCGGGCGG